MRFQKGPTNRGQIVVEYVLLLLLAVTLSTIIVKQLASRNSDDPGAITAKWREMLIEIAQDNPDCSNTYRQSRGIGVPCPARP